MAKVHVGPDEFIGEMVRALGHPGALLVSVDRRGRPNVMTIGWGSIGIYWGRPVFVVPVRISRYTYKCIEAAGDFTVNVLPRKLADLAQFCGTVSGRDHDKFAEASLTAARTGKTKSPIIQECVLHYVCQVVHATDLDPKSMNPKILRDNYPRGDYHRFFFGAILDVQAETNLRRRL
jgi:flavin reductase (DIM6/NTAB) family NADH-FMN oxidoreductase RutF